MTVLVPGNGSVAVVDDDEAVRDALQFVLEIAGYDVHGYASAQTFLPEANRHCWRYLVVDQHMPAMTGLDLVARLRSQGNRAPALLITGSISDDLRERAAGLNMTAVLQKPLADDELLRLVAAA